MWWECIPPATIIVVAMTIPGYALHYLNLGFLGNAYKRTPWTLHDLRCEKRDLRLTGDIYKVNGLESLPDEK